MSEDNTNLDEIGVGDTSGTDTVDVTPIEHNTEEKVANTVEIIGFEQNESISNKYESKDDSPEQVKNEENEENGGKEAEKEEDSSEEVKKEEEAKKEEEDLYEVKINGETTKVDLQELKNGYSGAKEVQRRFTELDNERKEWQNEKSVVQELIQTIGAHFAKDDVFRGVAEIAELTGRPSYVLKEQLITALTPEIVARYNMTDEELRYQQLKTESEHLASTNESERQRREAEQAKEAEYKAQQELQANIQSIRETHSVSEEEWDQMFDKLDNELPAEEDLTIDKVLNAVLEARKVEETTNIVQSLVTSLPEEDQEIVNDAWKAELYELKVSNPQLTEEDLKVVIQDSLDTYKKKRIEERLVSKGADLKDKPKQAPKKKVEIPQIGFGAGQD